ncbi:response regulator [Paraflavisolibacter sp. H34]|uniref:response regulator n=1 Tax=Huijunlia imazamoxiresistens TaxID=3127457 RepID=UPI00301B319B
MKRSVLFYLVDDDADDASIFEEVLLEVAPAACLQWAKDGEEALELLRAAEVLPDLVFLDLNMPRLNGMECLKQLKSESRLQEIPVIMYTTSSQAKDIEEALLTGALCFITKPSSMKGLRDILASFSGTLPGDLPGTLRSLSKTADTFIAC